MKIVTSCAPYRIERQQKCIASWQKYGYEIISLQPPHQVESTKLNFPDITVVESTNTGDILNKPNNIRIASHIKLAKIHDCNILLINSDIELLYTKEEFNSLWAPSAPKLLKIGIRHDVYPKHTAFNMSGIDVFQITPHMAMTLLDYGFTIGTAMWDYWLIWDLYLKGYSFQVEKEPKMLHEWHDDRWSHDDWLTSVALFNKHFTTNVFEAAKHIARITGREI